MNIKNRNDTKRKWNRTIRDLKRIGRYQCEKIDDFWYDTGLSTCRFRVLPEIYQIVQSHWEPAIVPLVMELLYCKSVICYRDQFDNLFKLMIIDNAIGDYKTNERLWAEKMQLLAFLEKDICVLLLDEIDWAEVEHAKDIAVKVHESKNWREYYCRVIKPIIQEIAVYGAWSRLFSGENAEEIARQLSVPEELDSEIVRYLIDNALGYVEASDCYQYNPLWIFGSEPYGEILEDIWSWDWKKLEKLNKNNSLGLPSDKNQNIL